MLAQIRPALTLIVFFTVFLGVVMPVGISALAELALPFQAGGSLIARGNTQIGSALIGQPFTQPKYFWPRPSALTGADPKDSSKTIPTPYDASESGASNLAPSAKALVDRVHHDVAGNSGANVPADAVTTSGSGLDPDISPENAARQAPRVATARGLPLAQVQALIDAQAQPRALGIFGEPHINVLRLNLVLDALRK